MDAVLRQIADALAELSDHELHALIAAANDLPQAGPRFLAWFELIVDEELKRRVFERNEAGQNAAVARVLGEE